MELFQEQFDDIEAWLAERATSGDCQTIAHDPELIWPAAGQRNLVIGQDVAVELGHPRDGSLAFIIWRESTGIDHGGRIDLVGPDIAMSVGRRLPFAKVVMIHGRGFDTENTYQRYRRLEAVRYAIDLKGYMMRAVSQVNREWARVNRDALENGFSFATLGGALIKAFSAIDFVDRVDILLVTSSRADVMTLQPLAERVGQVIAAMNKMSAEMDFDCGSCTYAAVCSEVSGLRAMRETAENQNA